VRSAEDARTLLSELLGREKTESGADAEGWWARGWLLEFRFDKDGKLVSIGKKK
jgi:hypothetical protein